MPAACEFQSMMEHESCAAKYTSSGLVNFSRCSSAPVCQENLRPRLSPVQAPTYWNGMGTHLKSFLRPAAVTGKFYWQPIMRFHYVQRPNPTCATCTGLLGTHSSGKPPLATWCHGSVHLARIK